MPRMRGNEMELWKVWNRSMEGLEAFSEGGWSLFETRRPWTEMKIRVGVLRLVCCRVRF